MNKHTSNVWSYFTKLDNTYAKCNICYNKYSYKTTLTNLKKHLSGPHDTILKQEHNLHNVSKLFLFSNHMVLYISITLFETLNYEYNN